MHWGEKDFFFPPFPSQMELYFSGPQLPAGVAGSVHCHSSGMWLMPRVCDYNSSFLFLLSFSWWLRRSLFLSHNGLWNLSHFWQLLLNSGIKVLICIVRTKRSRWRLYFWPWFMLIHHWQKKQWQVVFPYFRAVIPKHQLERFPMEVATPCWRWQANPKEQEQVQLGVMAPLSSLVQKTTESR